MNFSIKTFQVKEGSTYLTIAKQLIETDEELKKIKNSDFLIQRISSGIKKHLANKKLKAGETIKLVNSPFFYLNSTNITTNALSKKLDTKNLYSPNYMKVVGNDIHISIKEYAEYKNYTWHEYYSNGEEKYGEIGNYQPGGINGDKKNSKNITDGYLYIFDNNNNNIIKHVFVIENSNYTELKVINGKCFYNKKIDRARKQARIKNFFSEKHGSLLLSKQFIFLYSKIRISSERLENKNNSIPQFIPNHLGIMICLFRSSIGDIEFETGEDILKKYRNREGTSIINYNLKVEKFNRKSVELSIHYPNPLQELKRRAKIFQQRFEAREKWLNDINNVNQRFLYNLIDSMLEKDSSFESYASKENLKSWKSKYDEILKTHNFKINYALESLIQWLESNKLNSCLFNYLLSDNEKNISKTLDAYQNAITYIDQHWLGENFFEKQLNSKSSFINLALGLKDDEITPNNRLSKKIISLLNSSQLNQNTLSSAGAASRKTEQAFLELTQKSAPLIIKILGRKAIIKLLRKIANGSLGNIELPEKLVKPFKKADKFVSVLDLNILTKKIETFTKSKGVNRIITTFEAINVIIAVHALATDEENVTRNIAGLLGAAIDFSTENHWIFNSIKNTSTIQKLSFGGKAIPGLQLISGALDCFVGVDSAIESYKNGEIGVTSGFVTFAVGGAITSVGAALILSGGTTATVSVGTASAPAGALVIVGCVLEAIGLWVTHYFDNKNAKDWLEKSIFGSDSELLKNINDKYAKIKTPKDYSDFLLVNRSISTSENRFEDYTSKLLKITDNEIKSINSIMCKFNVDIDFDFDFFTFGKENGKIRFDIEPGIITNNATIHFNDLKYYTSSGKLISNHNFTKNGKIELLTAKSIKRNSKGQIRLIECYIDANSDVSMIKGSITINMNNGSLQTYTQHFEKSASNFNIM